MVDTIKVRVHYRLAKCIDRESNLESNFLSGETLESMLRKLLNGKLGKDVNSRIVKTHEDERHSACLHSFQINSNALVFDLLHLDDRREITTWKRPTSVVPVSTLAGTKLAEDEVSLHEPAYLMVVGNHLAIIERMGLRTATIENYLNDALVKSGGIERDGNYWRLIPRIEAIGVGALTGGVEKIVLKPRAALVGEGASTESVAGRKPRAYVRKLDEYVSYGEKIFDMLKVFGAHQADIEQLRSKMSSDLVLKARVEISVSKAERSSEAKVSADDITVAFAHVAETSDIDVIDKDGRTNGKLTQLSHLVEVAHDNGIIELATAMNALSAAISSWVAKGAIEIQ